MQHARGTESVPNWRHAKAAYSKYSHKLADLNLLTACFCWRIFSFQIPRHVQAIALKSTLTQNCLWGKVGKSGKKWSAMLFRGRSYRSLDPKGRLMLTPEFRDMLLEKAPEGTLVLTSYDGCLVAYPKPEWDLFEEKFSRLRNPTRKMRDFRRLVLGGAEEIIPDAQGRIRLSKSHMDYAALEKDAVLIGQGNRFEIWAQARFDALTAQNFDDLADELAQSGIDFDL